VGEQPEPVRVDALRDPRRDVDRVVVGPDVACRGGGRSKSRMNA